jgi:hypothetical protein
MNDRAPKLFAVPAGSKSTRCNGATCTAEIYFVRNDRTGRMMPVHCDVEGGRRPSEKVDPAQLDAFGASAQERDGVGVSHFTDCPDANQFSGQSRRVESQA